jgi:alkaline phosphatase D
MNDPISRRMFARRFTELSVVAYAAPRTTDLWAIQSATEDRDRPNITCGVASGDVTGQAATLWSRSDRPSKMIVELASNEAFRDAIRVEGPDVLESTDFTGKVRVRALQPGQPYYYRISFADLDDPRRRSAPQVGMLATAPDSPRDVRFAWSGDTAGQGYGIDRDRGGMKTFEAIRNQNPDFFVNSGDVIYADNPLVGEVKLEDGTLWKNLVTEGKSKVAETIEEFRANYRYNLMDENLLRLNAQVPMLVQWDDHETLNNWYPGERLQDDNRYQVKSISLLAARAKQAFFEYLPIRSVGHGPQRIHRSIAYGPLLELFFLDQRSFRGPNSPNRQTERSQATDFLGTPQLEWLKQALRRSQATWKVICADMPIGLMVRDGREDFENAANGNGPALGRELEMAELLAFVKKQQIKNLVWLTADVHYAASYYYHPDKAVFKEFDPFWEFVSGPLHAGTFGPGTLDNTFGPELKFKAIPDRMRQNRPPSDGFQFFGMVKIAKDTRTMTVEHYNAAGNRLWNIDLAPATA